LEFLPKEMLEGLQKARKADLRRKNRLRVEANGESYKILRFQDDGFTVDSDDAPNLRGLVDIFDGGRHLYQCLIVASERENGEMRFDFKRNTMASDKAPLDFYRDPEAPIALLGSK
jgi:hypothetical protein